VSTVPQPRESATQDYKNGLKDPRERDYALKDYKSFLKRQLKLRPASVNAAIALLLLYTGMRIGECVDLDLDNIYTGPRKRRVIIRDGKGGHYQEIPLNPQGNQMATASIDLIVRKIGRDYQVFSINLRPAAMIAIRYS
jgi:integrase